MAVLTSLFQPPATIPVGWYDLQIGGGGNVIGLDINPTDGTFLAWVDVGGLWLSNTSGGTWTNLLNATSMPNPQVSATYYNGVYYAKSAPSNSNTIYVIYGGNLEASSPYSGVMISTNKGATWTQITAITSGVPSPNGSINAQGQMIVINPLNDAEAYIGVPGSSGGLWHVTGHTSATRLDPGTIPSANSSYGYYGMSWLGSTIAIGVYGTGVYLSTNGGSTWGASSGAPTDVIYAGFGSDGTYYALSNPTTGQPYRLLSGTWAAINTGITSISSASLIVDPTNPAHVVLGLFDGQMLVSTNANTATAGSVSWIGTTTSEQVNSPDVPWISWSFPGQPTSSYLNMNKIAFDNAVTGKIWGAIGIGMLYCTSQPTSGTITWTSMTLGQESLVANWVVWPPGGPPILSAWDRPAWVIQNPNSPQSAYAPDNSQTIRYGAGADFAKNNASYVVILSAGALYYATDGGVSNIWTAMVVQPLSGPWDCLAVMTSTQMCAVDFSGDAFYETQNGGASWTQPASLPSTGWKPGGFAPDAHTVCCDGVTAGTVYAYNNSSGTAPGVYASTNYGVTWTKVFTGALYSGDQGSSQLKAAFGQVGNLFWTAGPDSTPTSFTNPLLYSANGGASWNGVTNSAYKLSDVWAFGFSAAAPGHTYPSLLVYGWMSTNGGSTYKLSFWRCDNFDAGITSLVWTDMGYAFNSLDQVACIEGNQNAYNQWIRGALATGFVYYGPKSVTW